LEPQYSADAQKFIVVAQYSYREKAFKAEFIIVRSVFGLAMLTSDKCNEVVKLSRFKRLVV
jgi:hypothetical protein